MPQDDRHSGNVILLRVACITLLLALVEAWCLVGTQALTGLASLISGGSAIPFFGVFEIPAFSDRHDDLHDLFTETHHFISVLIYPLFAVHITAAIYHQIFGVLDN